MDCKVEAGEDTVRITVAGRIDEAGAEDLKEHLQGVDTSNLKDAVIDLGQVTYLGSAGVGKLLLFYKAVASREGRVSIVNIPSEIYQHFKRVKLDDIFVLRAAP